MASLLIRRALPSVFGIFFFSRSVAAQGVPRLDSYNGRRRANPPEQQRRQHPPHHRSHDQQGGGPHPRLPARAQPDHPPGRTLLLLCERGTTR